MKTYEIDLEVKSVKTVRVTVPNTKSYDDAIVKAVSDELSGRDVLLVQWKNWNLIRQTNDE